VKRSLICAFTVLLVAGWGAAETGSFNSFSTTVTPANDGYDFDLLLTTNDATSQQTDDWVYFFLMIGPVDQLGANAGCETAFTYLADYGHGYGDGTGVERGTVPNNQFAASFSFPGLTNPVGYKWSAWAIYETGSIDDTPSDTVLSSIYYFLYSTVCPWLTGPDVTAGSLVWTFTDTDSSSPNPDTGVWRQGVIVGSLLGTGAPIPTLGMWGLLVLGVLLAGTGLFILRRV